jgi:ligand-binding sensor protein
MTIPALRNKEEWDRILAEFAREVRMTTCLTDDTGINPCCRFERYPLCAAIRNNREATTYICSQSNTAMLAVVRKTGRPEIDFCEAGLIRLVVPIFRDDRLIGQVFACGLASAEEELNSFVIARQLNMSEEAVLDLAKATPFGTVEQLKRPVDRLWHMLNSRIHA